MEMVSQFHYIFLLILCTGQIIDINDIEKVVRKAKQNNIMVIVDEAYGDYMSKDNSAINLVGKYIYLFLL
mgnify:CR=1 FL=1